MNPAPSICRMVIYRSRTGDYDVPAVITATVETLNPKGVELGHVPALTDESHVHLTVFTPGKPGKRRGAEDFLVESEHGRGENVSGCYQEWDIPRFDGAADEEPAPGSWRWPACGEPRGPCAGAAGPAQAPRERVRAQERV
jgi:hypothetical protein